MALASHLAQIGFGSRDADFLGDTQASGIAAAGTTQGAATALTASINAVSTATGGVNDAVLLPSALTFKPTAIVVRNDSGATIQVFPASGEGINSLAANTALNITNTNARVFFKLNTAQWVST